MGSYIYKVTSKTVDLDNGEQANVALYAYKPYWMAYDADQVNARLHFKTGCVTCDHHREKRTGWIVLGYEEDDGTITVGARAFNVGRKYGSFNDDAMDGRMHSDDTRWARITKIGKGFRYNDLPQPCHPAVGLLQKAEGVAWYAVNPIATPDYFESNDLAAVEAFAEEMLV